MDKLFMILTLYGLRADLDPVRHQILASPTIPSMEEVFARLLCIFSPIVTDVENPSPDSSVLISHSSTRGGRGLGGQGRGHRSVLMTMVDEMNALHTNGTWELVFLPSGKFTIRCKWVYTVKVHPDGYVDRLKARLVVKGYTQVYDVDYSKTFSPIAKIASVKVFISLASIFDWRLHQLDIKNAFLHGDLDKEVFIEQPPGFVA
ncbi:Retrovirus-related pol polyprotein from transposon tnt 1-94 [Quillaja saponaria]|uniref:Retrovirus-related pol polyprotein from transposon tnt 1-94 n=1 Tax=Quillaja saponaria TaxID=32244 RepID=A0AAD7LU96_QUISA|nr:Retrovirus-related pol polyprotein from transposon tnt 1-94 [Quillaja saponaria]